MLLSRLKPFYADFAALVAVITPTSATEVVRVQLGTFEIDATEVTIGNFRTYARSKSLTTTAEREGGSFEYSGSWMRRAGWNYAYPQGDLGAVSEPAVHITWAEADAYCRHAGGRLPTIAEWRAAAYTEQRDQPTDGFIKGRTYPYPVGDDPVGMNNNRRAHVVVGRTKRGINGLYDMGANVWEWIADRRGDEALTAGGSWWYGPEQTRANGAQWKAASFHAVYIGFRCVYDVSR